MNTFLFDTHGADRRISTGNGVLRQEIRVRGSRGNRKNGVHFRWKCGAFPMEMWCASRGNVVRFSWKGVLPVEIGVLPVERSETGARNGYRGKTGARAGNRGKKRARNAYRSENGGEGLYRGIVSSIAPDFPVIDRPNVIH